MTAQIRRVFLTPVTLLMIATLAVPLVIVGVYSFLSRGAYGGVTPPFTLENYTRLFDPLYGVILIRSFWIAGISTALCVLLGFPLALFIAQSGPRKNFYLSLVILPFWTSFLIRTYAWMFLLRDTGLINTGLQSLHFIHAPLPMLYNDGAVILGLVYGYLPFMVLPLFATLVRAPSKPSGASRFRSPRPASAPARFSPSSPASGPTSLPTCSAAAKQFSSATSCRTSSRLHETGPSAPPRRSY